MAIKAKTCEGCEKTYQPYYIRQRYCSRSCYIKTKRTTYIKTCEYCGEEFLPPESVQKFCNQVCYGKSKRKYNPKRRKGAIYMAWRNAVLERDGYTCQICGYEGDKLNVHHIVGWIDSVELRHETENGITLCVPCHMEKHRHRKR